MSLKNLRLTQWMQRLESAFDVTMPTAVEREGSDEIVTSQNGFPDADVSSLSIALYQMGLCKHLPGPDAGPTVSRVG